MVQAFSRKSNVMRVLERIPRFLLRFLRFRTAKRNGMIALA